MITSGLVLTLDSDPALAGLACSRLRERGELTLGEQNKRWLPVVAQTADVGSGRDLHDWLSAVPGVVFVDVVHVDFDETQTDSNREVADEH